MADSRAISTVKAFQLAGSSNIETITPSQWSTDLPQLKANGLNGNTANFSGELGTLQSYISEGYTVVTTTHEETLDAWKGIGFIAEKLDGSGMLVSQHWVIATSNTVSNGGATTSIVNTNPIASQTFDSIYGEQVNTVNGATIDDITDINIPTAGLPLTFPRHYDSSTVSENSSLQDSTLGLGWFGTYSNVVIANSDFSQVQWRNSQGTVETFTLPVVNSQDNSETIYSNPESVYGQFRRDKTGNQFFFTDENGETYTFTYSGTTGRYLLHSITDLHVNGAYSN